MSHTTRLIFCTIFLLFAIAAGAGISFLMPSSIGHVVSHSAVSSADGG